MFSWRAIFVTLIVWHYFILFKYPVATMSGIWQEVWYFTDI